LPRYAGCWPSRPILKASSPRLLPQRRASRSLPALTRSSVCRQHAR
jgi:hypothetical protein